MPKNVVAHFDLVEAAIESGNCTVTASAVDAALLANVAAAVPPTEDAWKPTLASIEPQAGPAAAAASDQQRNTPRALLVSRALTSAAEASVANARAANVTVVPVTHPTLATPSASSRLKNTSDAANVASVDAQNGFDAWRRLSHVVTLKTKCRAAGDPEWMALLQRVRSHTVGPRDLATLGRMRTSPSHVPPLDAAAAWCANADVDATNCNAVRCAAAVAKSTVRLFPAAVRPHKNDPPVNPDGPAHAGHVVGSRTASRADLLCSFLDVYVGCPVTVNMSNALTEHGIANGSRGVVVGACPPLADVDMDDVSVTLPTRNKRPVNPDWFAGATTCPLQSHPSKP